jgi:hypothetical protein
MWELTATGIYYLTNQGFSIYVDCHTGRQFATVENAKLYGWTLRYQVISLDWFISNQYAFVHPIVKNLLDFVYELIITRTNLFQIYFRGCILKF